MSDKPNYRMHALPNVRRVEIAGDAVDVVTEAEVHVQLNKRNDRRRISLVERRPQPGLGVCEPPLPDQQIREPDFGLGKIRIEIDDGAVLALGLDLSALPGEAAGVGRGVASNGVTLTGC